MIGQFIAIEGGDGSGKGTQFEKLSARYKKEGYDVLKVDFPQYGQPSAEIIEKYLNGEYGQADSVPADLISLAYAIDRYTVRDKIRAHLSKPNSVVLANRYVASNLAHQGTKIQDETARHAFYERVKYIEYELLGLVRPTLNIVLIVPTDIAQANVDKKAQRDYTSSKRDIHEADASHLDRAKSNYSELCKLYPEEFTQIQCTHDGAMRSIDSIHEDIWSKIQEKA